jgi:hypothetical protein
MEVFHSVIIMLKKNVPLAGNIIFGTSPLSNDFSFCYSYIFVLIYV